ncbi:ATP-binding cassette domain-containing protein [Mariprofundus erugo]|uniref:ribosomal protection-like ABC-F family protein n=1 Tax=Mariprofundus erugo TaxID=2528639 RepID=UPI0010FF5955|nr:ATP-binding cassette domain-containing protein [Mariprofundus erugo]TLS75954.1 ATP-binding cassette domain-containing protein [Mariprofundus erugo]
MLYFDQLTLRRGSKLLFENATLTIHAGDKLGITGANGCGKSSLFGLVLGQLEEDSGRFRIDKGTIIAHVAQETPALPISAIRYIMQGDAELSQLEADIQAAEQHGHGDALARLHERMAAIDGYAAPARAARLMHGLGFAPGEEEHAVASFSGGWRMRLNLARALMCRSDLLLLDEPTNHLDLEAVIWLEKWLRNYQGAMLLISHDRDFLDRCVTHIAHIEQQRFNLYTGNYSAFEQIRTEQLAQQQAAHERQQSQIEHMNSYINRFKAKASKARQAQSRIKALERMQLIAPAHVDSPFSFSFSYPGAVPNPLLRLHKASAGYDGRMILKDTSFNLLPGERIGLLGPNGAGKSTLIKLLAGELAPVSGGREAAKELRIGYFAQHQLEQLHDELTPLQHLQMLDDQLGEKNARQYLGGFAFHGDMATSPVAPLSGGEKARLVLAMLVYQRPNLLLLDEPTNHLDLDMRHALCMALQDFEGAMILVSHDRHLLRSVCDELVLVADGSATPFQGDLEDYGRWLMSTRDAQETTDTAANQPSRQQERRNRADMRKALQPLRSRIKKLESDMEKLHRRKEELDLQLADPALYDGSQVELQKKLAIESGQLNQKIDASEAIWLEACEELELAEQESL